MYKTGDQLVYAGHGVCTVCDWEERVVDKKTVQYYVLQPVDQSASRFYVPAHNPAALKKLRPILTKDEWLQLLSSDDVRKDCWIADEGSRKTAYRELISSCDRESLLSMINTLHRHRSECIAQGRKFHLCDENFLRDAQRILSAELSVVLQIPPAEVPEYVQHIFER